MTFFPHQCVNACFVSGAMCQLVGFADHPSTQAFLLPSRMNGQGLHDELSQIWIEAVGYRETIAGDFAIGSLCQADQSAIDAVNQWGIQALK